MYKKTGWETLAERRRQKSLSFIYNIVNNNAPFYLIDLLPIRVVYASNNILRNKNNYKIPFTRLCSFEASFYPLRKQACSNILKILQPKKENFQIKHSDIFHNSSQSIDCG